jgi:endonuclease/exonuclease/phosphatase (EEP) superfamily protein YafD
MLEIMSVNAFLKTSSEPRPRRRLKLGSWALAGLPAFLLGYLAQIDLRAAADVPGTWVMPALQAVLFPLCVLALLAALVFLACRRVVAAVLLVIAVVAAGSAARIQDPAPAVLASAQELESAPEVRLLSVNAQLGGLDPAALLAEVKARQVQVLVLQEATEALLARLYADHGFAAALPHRTGRLPAVGADGTAILSAGPLVEERPAWPDGGRHFEQRTATVTLPGHRPFRVVAVHTLPPLADAGLWRSELDTLGTYQRARTDLPLVVAGDFNATQAMPGFRSAAEGLDDAARVAGWLPRPTWPDRPLPLAQLDHVLLRGLAPATWDTVALAGTDHRGVAVTLRAPAA